MTLILKPSDRNLENNFIYVPSIKLWVAKEKTYFKNWDEGWEDLEKQGLGMLPPLEFIKFLKYCKDNSPEIYQDITRKKEPWRAEWIDAYFEQRADGMYIWTMNKTKAEKLSHKTLMKFCHHSFGPDSRISLDDFLNKHHTRQGLPTKKTKPGNLSYLPPSENSVAVFFAAPKDIQFGCMADIVQTSFNIGVHAYIK